MDPIEYARKHPDETLYVHWDNHECRRILAEVFRTKKGELLFFDTGWPLSDGHPIHIIEGPMPTEGPPWQFHDDDRKIIDILTDDNPDKALLSNRDVWQWYRLTEGEQYDTESAREALHTEVTEE